MVLTLYKSQSNQETSSVINEIPVELMVLLAIQHWYMNCLLIIKQQSENICYIVLFTFFFFTTNLPPYQKGTSTGSRGPPYYFQYQRYTREFPDVDPSKSNNPGFNLLKIPMIMKLTDQSQKQIYHCFLSNVMILFSI